MEKTILSQTIRNLVLCISAGGALVACGGTSQDSSSSTQMLADGEACQAAWASATAYNGGAAVSRNGRNYTAAFWTQGQDPATNSGPSGSGQPWIPGYLCGSGTPTPAPTPTPTPAPTPTPTPAPTPTPTPTSTCTLQAEDYSTAYDDSTGNAGGAYRTGDVDIEATSDTGGGYDVGWIDTGEWLAHNNVTFPTTGSYTFQYRVASPNSTGVISSDLNAGSIQLGTTAIPNTGGWQTWTTVQRTVTVNAGTYNVGTYMSTGGFNLNWIKIVGASCSPTPTPTPTPTPAPTPTPSGFSSVVTETQFNQMFPSRGSFYTYAGLVNAANAIAGFASTGSATIQKQEAAAFLANVAHETGGLVYVEEIDKSGNYCDMSQSYGCPAGTYQYYGRGPLQLSWNFNYKAAGDWMGTNLLNTPSLLATDATLSWKSAMWYWMTQNGPGTMTSHYAMVNSQGFGQTIRSINGSLECNGNNTAQMQDRVNNYQNFVNILGVPAGSNLTC